MAVPVIIDGCALEHSGNDGCYGVCGDEREAAPTRPNKPRLDEDAEVKGEDREFGEVDGEFVEDLVEVEHLPRQSASDTTGPEY